MKIIEIDGNNNVVFITDCNDNSKIENFRIIDNIPNFYPTEGYSSGKLKYTDEKGIYWEPVEDVPEEEKMISSSELLNMIEEVL